MKADDIESGNDLAYRQALRYAEELRELYRRDRARVREVRAARESRARVQAIIDGREIGIVFQPIVDLDDMTPVGVEALARFASQPQTSPDRWFADATDAGLRQELELAAIEVAVAELRHVPAGAYLSLNVSPETIGPNLDASLSPVPGERLVIEVTEHAPVDDYEALSSALGGLRAGGGRLAIDDAGAGFASLRHILRLDPDIIKMDMALTRDIDTDRSRRALARALISFASEIGATIVAEGVETSAEVDALRELGVTYGQGYHLARPAPPGELASSLRSRGGHG